MFNVFLPTAEAQEDTADGHVMTQSSIQQTASSLSTLKKLKFNVKEKFCFSLNTFHYASNRVFVYAFLDF